MVGALHLLKDLSWRLSSFWGPRWSLAGDSITPVSRGIFLDLLPRLSLWVSVFTFPFSVRTPVMLD